MSSAADTSSEGKSSEELRAEIERTRSQMGSKIDTIQDRLSPDTLKQQAQTMVQDIIQESTDAIIEFARTGSKQAGRSMLDTIKANPLPSAVIGVGLGWLAMNMMKSQGSSDSDRYGYQGSAGAMYNRGQMGQMDYGSNYGSGYSSNYGGGMGAGRGMGQGAMMGARTFGGSLDESYSGEYGYEEEWHNNPEVHPDNMFQRGQGDESGGLTEKIGKVGDVAKSAVGKVGETAQNLAGTVAGAAQSAAGAVTGAAGKVGDVAQGTAGKVAGTAQGAVHGAGHMAGRVGEGAGSVAGSAMQMGQQARRQTMQAGRMAAGQAGNLANQAGSLANQGQYQAGRMGRTVQRSLEDNPMAFGAAALLAGVAIALALPATRQERQLLGDVRDQFMDKAQTFATNITEEAKQVVEEVQPRLQQTAQRVVDDLKMSGMQVTEDLKQTGKDAGQELKQTLKDAGTQVKSKIGVTGEGSNGEGMEQDTEIVSGLIVEEDETQPQPNVGGSYDNKFDSKS
jgi:hypothetical protein